MILIAFAFLAGLATILSPCILPVVPLVLATGSGAGRLRPLGVIAGLIGGFALVTLALAALLSALDLPGALLRGIAIGGLALVGAALLVPAWGAGLDRALGPLARLGAGRGGTG